MVAAHVELALLEDSFGNGDLPPPFSDRIVSVAARSGGLLLFDIRVDGDRSVQRMAAIDYRELGAALVLLSNRGGKMRCATVTGNVAAFVDELAEVASRPLAEQAYFDFRGRTSAILSFLRKTMEL